MKIHTVQRGDTIFSIARKYSTSPLKIIENNDLKNPDMLAVGTELLILTPTRTYSVRGGDTLSKISDRFDTQITEIYRNNPYLCGTDNIYPGQILSIKQDARGYGAASSIGYLFDGYSEERLNMAIHYTTHLALAAYKRCDGKITELFSTAQAMALAKKCGKIPVMRIYDTSGVSLLDENYINEIMKIIEKCGYLGVILSINEALYENASAAVNFLDSLYSILKEKSLSLFIERDLNRTRLTLPTHYDGAIMMYEKCALEEIESSETEQRIYTDTVSEDTRAYIDLPSFAYIGRRAISKGSAVNYARRSGNEILHDTERGICYFMQNSYKAGKKEVKRVAFESLENIKAKLDLIYELGLMGISFDIMRVPTEYLMTFHSLFALPTYGGII